MFVEPSQQYNKSEKQIGLEYSAVPLTPILNQRFLAAASKGQSKIWKIIGHVTCFEIGTLLHLTLRRVQPKLHVEG